MISAAERKRWRAELAWTDHLGYVGDIIDALDAADGLREALKAASKELWMTYGTTKRVEPLFKAFDAALARYDAAVEPQEPPRG